MILKVWESNGGSSAGEDGDEGEAEIGMWPGRANNAVKWCLEYRGDDEDGALWEAPPAQSWGLGWVTPGQAAEGWVDLVERLDSFLHGSDLEFKRVNWNCI